MARIRIFESNADLFEYFKNWELLLQYPEPVDWDRGSEAALLCRAVKQNDATAMENLLRTGINVNAEILYGGTALLMALKMDKLEAAKALLDADADVSVSDTLQNGTALGVLLNQPKTMINLESHLVGNLKRSNLDAEKLADLLAAADCPLKFVLSLNNAQVTQKFLERNTSNIGIRLMLDPAIDQRDFENVELILRHSSPRAKRYFYNTLFIIYFMKKMETWKAFIQRISDWDILCENGLKMFHIAFLNSSMEYLQVLLDSKIYVQAKEKFGIDLRASIFGNRRVDATELLENQDFKVNALGARLRTALHYAAVYDVLKNVQFLLDSGAHVDIQDINGKTPLSLCVTYNCINSGQLLLEHGADVQIIDENGLTVLEIAHNENSSLMELLIAQLAISGVQGLPIKQSIQDIITSNVEYTNIYEACCQQLQLLKSCEITKPVTLKISEKYQIILQPMSLFNVLTDKIETLCRFVRNRDIVSLLEQHRNLYELHSLYYSTLKIKLVMTSNRYRFQSAIAEIISERTGNIIDFDHLVIRKISEYSNHKDINAFIKCKFEKNWEKIVL